MVWGITEFDVYLRFINADDGLPPRGRQAAGEDFANLGCIQYILSSYSSGSITELYFSGLRLLIMINEFWIVVKAPLYLRGTQPADQDCRSVMSHCLCKLSRHQLYKKDSSSMSHLELTLKIPCLTCRQGLDAKPMAILKMLCFNHS